MPQTITDTAAIRSEAAYAAEGIDGAVTESQLQSSLNAAYLIMLENIDLETYEAVRDYNGSGAAEVKKKDAFLHAESCFALHVLPSVLNNQRLTKDGIKKIVDIGKNYQAQFASHEESKAYGQDWLALAYRWLSPYLSNDLVDDENETIGFKSRDGSFVMMSFGSED